LTNSKNRFDKDVSTNENVGKCETCFSGFDFVDSKIGKDATWSTKADVYEF
jgi:hypothetical protein